jgi:hypothetical protein
MEAETLCSGVLTYGAHWEVGWEGLVLLKVESKNVERPWTKGLIQAAGHPLCNHKTLSSNSSMIRSNNKKKRKMLKDIR